MRGDESSFYTALAQLADAIKKFEAGSLKFHQYSAQVDQIFASAHWSKEDFYAETNKLRGIQTHSYASEKKAVKKTSPRKKKAVAPTRARTLMFGDDHLPGEED